MHSTFDDEYKFLSISNVLIAYTFLLFAIISSVVLQTKLGGKIVLASIRCIIQLTIMGFLLKPILQSSNLPVMIALSLSMMAIGTLEISHFKLQHRIHGLFLAIFLCITFGCTAIAGLGSYFAIGSRPFYNPRQFLPILGMLLGNSITGTALSLKTFLDALITHKDRIEYMISVGGTTWEASRFAIVQSLQVGLLPCLNSMSLQGFVSIPGMMTGQILAGMNPMQAVKYQQIINFLICAATSITTLLSTLFVYFMVFDERNILDLRRLKSSNSALNAWKIIRKKIFEPRIINR